MGRGPRSRLPLARAVAVAALCAAAVASCSDASDDAPSASPSIVAEVSEPAPPAPSPSPSLSPEPAPDPIDVSLRTAVALAAPPGVDMGAAAGRSLVIPDGWTAEVWANIPGARIAVWAPDGRLVVSSADVGTVYAVTPQGEGVAPVVTPLVAGLAKPQGVAFGRYKGKDVLVIGEQQAITSWDYTDGVLTNPRVLVAGLPVSGHGAKGLAIDGQTVYYSLGSSGNRSPEDRTAGPERAVIASVQLDGSDNVVVAHGVRNGFGLGIAPDGSLFTVVNQSDNQTYPYQDGSGLYGTVVPEFVNENPMDQVARIVPGTDLGWPYCFPDATTSATGTWLDYVADPVSNPGQSVMDCTALRPTDLGIPAHSAPLDIEFTAGTPLEAVLGTGALIGVHGSWNRNPPREPAILWAPWDEAHNSLEPAVPLVTGFQYEDGSRWGRAVSAVAGPDGSLYVTDDEAGLVYRLTPPEA